MENVEGRITPEVQVAQRATRARRKAIITLNVFLIQQVVMAAQLQRGDSAVGQVMTAQRLA
jgi:hypothetical protein